MIEIKNKTKYYIYDCYERTYLTTFDSEEELIDWLVKTTLKSYYWERKGLQNKYLDNINITGKDTQWLTIDVGVSKLFTRQYIFIDSDNRIIDARKYWEIVKEKINNKKDSNYDDRIPEDVKHGDVLYRYSWWKGHEGRYRYRCGPVPNTAYHWRGKGYRRPRTFNEMKKNSDPEYKDYTRGRRKHLPHYWDELPISSHGIKSWKNNSKKKKQWM